MIYFYLKTDGEHWAIETQKPIDLELLQGLTAGGGCVEMQTIGNVTLCMDEEARHKESPINPFYAGYEILGDVLIGVMRPGKDGREFVGLDEFDATVVERQIRNKKLPNVCGAKE
ncbi:TPA: hypothetical protein DEB29_03560 [Candidatus Wolfebacteria bacterium]|nr:hypothetical protein [Candidatus Wolfebacteria bacterium]